jgi:hypothetical protein
MAVNIDNLFNYILYILNKVSFLRGHVVEVASEVGRAFEVIPNRRFLTFCFFRLSAHRIDTKTSSFLRMPLF